MKKLFFAFAAAFFLMSCETARPITGAHSTSYPTADTLITQSLFNDRSSTISEESIQKILEGSYRLPKQLRVAVVRLEPTAQQRRIYWNYWSDEQYLKTQQSYLDLFSEKLRQSARVTSLSIIPDLLISRAPSFTSIREAAVRMQADVVVVYAIASDLYSRYKLFSKPDLKAFATTQLILLDVKTGLVPFSAIVTKDVLSQRRKEELDNAEAAGRVQHEAVLLTINEVGLQLVAALNTK
jgi:hypothetical protein